MYNKKILGLFSHFQENVNLEKRERADAGASLAGLGGTSVEARYAS